MRNPWRSDLISPYLVGLCLTILRKTVGVFGPGMRTDSLLPQCVGTEKSDMGFSFLRNHYFPNDGFRTKGERLECLLSVS